MRNTQVCYRYSLRVLPQSRIRSPASRCGSCLPLGIMLIKSTLDVLIECSISSLGNILLECTFEEKQLLTVFLHSQAVSLPPGRSLYVTLVEGVSLDGSTNSFATPHPPPKVVPLPPLGKALYYTCRRLTHMWIYHIIIIEERFIC